MSQMKRFTRPVSIKMGSSEIPKTHHKSLQNLIKQKKVNENDGADEQPIKISPDETGWIG